MDLNISLPVCITDFKLQDGNRRSEFVVESCVHILYDKLSRNRARFVAYHSIRARAP